MTSSTQGMTPMRKRVVDDVRMGKLPPKTQTGYIAPCGSLLAFLAARSIRPRSRIGAISCTWSITESRGSC